MNSSINCEWKEWESQNVLNHRDNLSFVENFDCLAWVNSSEVSYQELKKLSIEWNTEKIKSYVKSNDMLRTSMHEAAHVIVWRLYGLIPDFVSIWDCDNNQGAWVQHMIWWISTWQTKWHSYLQFTDKPFVHMSLAGFVAECRLWIDYMVANEHAKQDTNDILDWQWFDALYERWLKPKYFNERWYLLGEKVDPKLSREDVKKELENIMSQEAKKLAHIIVNNSHDLYTLWIELYWNRNLDNWQINSILGIR